jgi:protein transport protein SEC23
VKILDELQGDPWSVKADQRPARCTGLALSVAANLLSACVPGVGGRILSFVGGPCTEGLGMVCIINLHSQINGIEALEEWVWYPCQCTLMVF